jgi:predicted dehydrogenase/threonine dehydrogenase-like Zn-dependent dehydrogenase
MKQVVQNLATGETIVQEVPSPNVRAGCVLVRSNVSLISAGTERMLVNFGRASLLDKVLQQPEKVREVLNKVRTDGISATLEAVQSKLDQPLALGYCNVGRVISVAPDVSEFSVGDRVVSNGAHASVVCVPKNLCALAPAGVDDQTAVFTVLAAIGLQGIRLAAPSLGEVVAVSGLGLIGLLAVQMLRANGCRVIGVDFDQNKLRLARQMGAETVDLSVGEDPVAVALRLTGGVGVDAVLITASTKSSEPVSQAARMSRKRGRIVLVGVTGLELNRSEFYEKELSFQVSCSYGPGRYDPSYELEGHDYPVGYVRWTEQRNFEAVLRLMLDGRVTVPSLITHRFSIDQATNAYDVLTKDPSALAIVLDYHSEVAEQLGARTVILDRSQTGKLRGNGVNESSRIGVIGAGNYGSRVLIPALKRGGAELDTLVAGAGAAAVHYGRKFGFSAVSTDVAPVIESNTIGTVVIATRHDSHAALTAQALKAGKNVYVEKPLALEIEQVDEIEAALSASGRAGESVRLMVGFNRRFAPLAIRMKSLLDVVREPKALIYTCNAGLIPPDHWTQKVEVGGGRIIGEACHFVDFFRFLIGAEIKSADIVTLAGPDGNGKQKDKAIITLAFADGSIGSIHYYANGGKTFPKERIEAFAGNAVLQLDNFVRLRGFGWPNFRSMSLWRMDKGHDACVAAFLNAVKQNGPSPIPADELFEVARVTIRLANSQ